MKKYFLSASVFLFLVMASAFVKNDQRETFSAKPLTQEWFIFTGAPGQENDPSKYQLVTMEPDDCTGGTVRCSIFAQRQTASNPVVPNLSQPYDYFNKP